MEEDFLTELSRILECSQVRVDERLRVLRAIWAEEYFAEALSL